MRILIQLIQLVVIVGFFIMLYKWNKTRTLRGFKTYHEQKRREFTWLDNWIKANGDPSEKMAGSGSMVHVVAAVAAFLVLMIITYFIGNVGIVPTLVYLAIAAGVCWLLGRRIMKNPSGYKDDPRETGLTLECPSCHCPHAWAMLQKEVIFDDATVHSKVTTTTIKGGGTDWGFGAGDSSRTSEEVTGITYYGKEIRDFKCLNCGHTEHNEYEKNWSQNVAPEAGVYTYDPPKTAFGYEELLKKIEDEEENFTFTGNDKKTYSNGNTYEGDFVNGKPHGKGKYTWSSGDVYEGSWVKGVQDGKGKETRANGEMYEGVWANGKKHGKGKETLADGTVYEGDYVKDLAHGKGKTTFASGAVYEGDFVNGNFHGKGKYSWPDGIVYEGDFAKNNFHGIGKKTYPNGKVEEGRWENDEFVGE